MNPPRSPKQIYLDVVKPDDFADIQIHDWVEGVGDVSTHYEEKFLRNYGKLLVSRPATTQAPCPQHKIWQHCPVAEDIAAQAREELITEFAERFRSAYIFFDDVKFDETINSLRSTSTKETTP